MKDSQNDESTFIPYDEQDDSGDVERDREDAIDKAVMTRAKIIEYGS